MEDCVRLYRLGGQISLQSAVIQYRGIRFSSESVIRVFDYRSFAICVTKLGEFGACSICSINVDRVILSEMNY